jgi:hypothetical protein
MKLFYGVVENNIDLEKLGRVQVRIVGKHTDNRTDATAQDYMPVTDLPWAQTLQQGTVMSNESSMFTVPKNGTVVVLSFMDEDEQFPIIMGSVPKIPESLPDFTKGFSDPLMMNPTPTSLGSSPVSNYATGTPTPLSVTRKKVVEPMVTCVNETWTEPPTTFKPSFPDNLVIQSGDNVIELDDSLLNNRVNIEHSSGTFEETHPTGIRVTKIKGVEYVIVEGNRNILVYGKSNITALAHNMESLTELNLKSLTSLTIDTDGLLTIKAGTAIIDIDGMLMVNASMISLN